MKRGTPRHPKIDHLMAIMHWNRATAVGTLELLWHFADEFAPQGDIGKYDDRRIEAAMDYLPHGQRKTGRLIEALIESKWVDKDAQHRLNIHHWADHCQSNTVQRLSKQGLTVFGSYKNHGVTEEKHDPRARARPAAMPSLAIALPAAAAGAADPWPLARSTIAELYPATDDNLINKIIAAAAAAHAKATKKGTALTDQILNSIIRAHTRRDQRSAALYLRTIPAAVKNELENHERKKP